MCKIIEKAEKIPALKNLIPQIINSDGKVNVGASRDFVGDENTTSNNKGYELTFTGKSLARAQADTETSKELKEKTI